LKIFNVPFIVDKLRNFDLSPKITHYIYAVDVDVETFFAYDVRRLTERQLMEDLNGIP